MGRIELWVVRMRLVRSRGGLSEIMQSHVVIALAACETDDQRGHGHLDVEFHHVSDRVELDVYDLVLEKHESDEHTLVKC